MVVLSRNHDGTRSRVDSALELYFGPGHPQIGLLLLDASSYDDDGIIIILLARISVATRTPSCQGLLTGAISLLSPGVFVSCSWLSFCHKAKQSKHAPSAALESDHSSFVLPLERQLLRERYYWDCSGDSSGSLKSCRGPMPMSCTEVGEKTYQRRFTSSPSGSSPWGKPYS